MTKVKGCSLVSTESSEWDEDEEGPRGRKRRGDEEGAEEGGEDIPMEEVPQPHSP